MSALEGPLIDWIEQREAVDRDDTTRVVVRLPEKLADEAWIYVNAMIEAIANARGASHRSSVGVSTTAGADDVTFSLSDGTHGNIYIVCGDRYVL